MEANQKVPPFLAELCSENEKYLNLGGKTKLNASRFRTFILNILQMRGVVVIAAVWDTELQIVLNWRPYRINRPQISAGGIILQIRQLIISFVL